MRRLLSLVGRAAIWLLASGWLVAPAVVTSLCAIQLAFAFGFYPAFSSDFEVNRLFAAMDWFVLRGLTMGAAVAGAIAALRPLFRGRWTPEELQWNVGAQSTVILAAMVWFFASRIVVSLTAGA